MNIMPRPASRVLIATHGHPALSNGGSELAAWRLFEQLGSRPEWQAWLIGCAREFGGRPGSAISQPFSDREFLYAADQFDWFKFANRDPRLPRAFSDVLEATRPDILHFHHYANFGVESFMHAKRVLPDCKVVLTLHEFQAICNYYGQMVTRQNKALCYAASARDCSLCFPDVGRAEFFLRETYIKRFFQHVDHFIAPSRFLGERYVAWGIPADRLSVIENITAPAAPVAEATAGERSAILRVGFFGQISLLKGIGVLLEAARIAEKDPSAKLTFDIHGDYSGQPQEFQTDFLARLERAGHNVRYHGPYDNHRVDQLMRAVDVVLLPSIWWENSPVVIQEALRNRRPIVCSDIGGMAEKVRHGLDGFHFPVGDAAGLADLLRSLAIDREGLSKVQRTIRSPDPAAATADQHLALYDTLLRHDRPAAARPSNQALAVKPPNAA